MASSYHGLKEEEKKSKCFITKCAFKCFFCYGLKLNDFLNFNFFVTKVTFEWLLSFMSLRNKKKRINVSLQNLHPNGFFSYGLKLNDFLIT